MMRWTMAVAAAALLVSCQDSQQGGGAGGQQRGQTERPGQEEQARGQQPAQGSPGTGATGGAGTTAGMAQQVEGTIAKAGATEVVIRPQGGAEMRLTIDETTRVMVDGEPASPDRLQEGSEVRAAYQSQGGEPKATLIEAQGSAGGTQPGGTTGQPGGGAGGAAGAGGGPRY